jgi:alkanesulfonate monooxygenase SsuD/methylene tetrahydromethanopterin reductase-like flavin-dependent oxidoreductase (luciferase family)
MPKAGPEYFRAKLPMLRRYAQEYGRGAVEFGVATGCRINIASSEAEAMAIARRTFESDREAEWLKRHDIPDISSTWLYGPPEPIADAIRRFEAAGVTLLFLDVVAHSLSAIVEQLHRFAEEVMPLLARTGEPNGSEPATRSGEPAAAKVDSRASGGAL